MAVKELSFDTDARKALPSERELGRYVVVVTTTPVVAVALALN